MSKGKKIVAGIEHAVDEASGLLLPTTVAAERRVAAQTAAAAGEATKARTAQQVERAVASPAVPVNHPTGPVRPNGTQPNQTILQPVVPTPAPAPRPVAQAPAAAPTPQAQAPAGAQRVSVTNHIHTPPAAPAAPAPAGRESNFRMNPDGSLEASGSAAEQLAMAHALRGSHGGATPPAPPAAATGIPTGAITNTYDNMPAHLKERFTRIEAAKKAGDTPPPASWGDRFGMGNYSDWERRIMRGTNEPMSLGRKITAGVAVAVTAVAGYMGIGYVSDKTGSSEPGQMSSGSQLLHNFSQRIPFIGDKDNDSDTSFVVDGIWNANAKKKVDVTSPDGKTLSKTYAEAVRSDPAALRGFQLKAAEQAETVNLGIQRDTERQTQQETNRYRRNEFQTETYTPPAPAPAPR